MEWLTVQAANGEIQDIIFLNFPRIRKMKFTRIKCFCYIEEINDYGFIYTKKLRFLEARRRIKWYTV